MTRGMSKKGSVEKDVDYTMDKILADSSQDGQDEQMRDGQDERGHPRRGRGR